MSVSESVSQNIMVYRLLRLLSSKYISWSYYKDGIIDKDGVIIDKEKATTYMKFAINIKKLISFHPMGKIKLSSLPLALSLLRESREFKDFEINEELLTKLLQEAGMIEG